jgi:hypothetical protein
MEIGTSKPHNCPMYVDMTKGLSSNKKEYISRKSSSSYTRWKVQPEQYPHPAHSNYPVCRHCKKEIYFDPHFRTRNYKLIPMDPGTNKPHSCLEGYQKLWQKQQQQQKLKLKTLHEDKE